MACSKPKQRLWAPSHTCFTSEAEFDRLCSHDDADGRALEREAQTRQRTIVENLVDSTDLLMMSGQSTASSGSYHKLPIVPATPKNSSNEHYKPSTASHNLDVRSLDEENSREQALWVAYRSPPRLWEPSHTCFPSEAEFDRLCSHDDPAGRPLKREAQTRQRAIIETLVDSKDLLMMSGQSTPASGSYHDSPIVPATPKNSSQHRLVLARETVAIATAHKQHAPTTPRRRRHTHGHVTIKTCTSQQTGFAALLCIEKGVISVVGGAELDNTILSMPLPYAELKVVPGHDNMLELKVKTPGAKPNGILVVVSDCSVRDKWLEAFSVVGVKIEGHSVTVATMP